MPPATACPVSRLCPCTRTYEDAEDASIIGWDIFDSEPAGAIVTNVYDSGRGSRVIELTGSGPGPASAPQSQQQFFGMIPTSR